ncbi:MAG: 4Fe-4S dicluster-binding protein [Candidatus Margulisiibacteriota bacterium]
MKEEKPGWKKLAKADVLPAGTAESFETGDWRSDRPTWHPERCIQCLICWISCPDTSILVKDSKMTGIDLKHCKGCGICARECPVKPEKAITMSSERECKL